MIYLLFLFPKLGEPNFRKPGGVYLKKYPHRFYIFILTGSAGWNPLSTPFLPASLKSGSGKFTP